jgi:chorismate-pyruvate lyase
MLDRASAGSRAVRSVDLWKYDEHVVGESTSKEKALAYTVTLVQALARIEIGEVVSAPRVETSRLLDAVFDADLAAFTAQSPRLASRYRC